ncbi:MAG: hypothetical protein J5645_06715 [Lachnospiraceae bacterium]|nr:hypothetical protein [Lachnospiraceae bacterium]
MLTKKVGFGLLAFLLCLGVFAGCKSDTKDSEKNATVTVTTTPEATSTPTATPTPTVAFVKTAFETFGRDDIYRVPVEELEKADEYFLMNTVSAGEYILLWFNLTDEDVVAPQNRFVLLNPCKSTEQMRLKVDYLIAEPVLLADGTVVLQDRDTYKIYVYDNTLKELASFMPRGEAATTILGVSEDGTLWHADNASRKVLGTNLKGEPAGEYAFGDKYEVTHYLGSNEGRKTFLATLPGTYEYDFMVIGRDGSVEFRNESERDLGDDWKTDRIAPYRVMVNTNADATWFFHEAGYMRNCIAFPKFADKEQVGLFQGTKFVGNDYIWFEDGSSTMEYRVYDLEKRTVSETLVCNEIKDSVYAAVKGVVGGNYIVMVSSHETPGNDLLLWDASVKTTPIVGFCDFSKDDPATVYAELLKKAEAANIAITPDRTEDDGTILALGDFMTQMDLVNSFLLIAKENPDLLKTNSGAPIQPENMRNNDGAHYTFNPHVFSTFYLKEHGEKLRDAFFRYVDAVRAGEDRFRCEDVGQANWSSGKFAFMFYPLAFVYADVEYTGDGWASITYKIPKEEFLAKVRDFESRIESILNDVLEEDYSDFEKTLALYEFLTEYAVYDYEMLEHNEETEWQEKQSSYRVLMEHTGICGEIAILYQYLALQCGVDMDESVGMPVQAGEDMHAWDYVCIDGVGYLVDATWGLTANRAPDLRYFLFTDELREKRDGYLTESCDVGFHGLYGARKKFNFDAKDTRYEALWDGYFVAFDEAENCIFYRDLKGVMKRFDYEEK